MTERKVRTWSTAMTNGVVACSQNTQWARAASHRYISILQKIDFLSSNILKSQIFKLSRCVVEAWLRKMILVTELNRDEPEGKTLVIIFGS